MGTDYDSRPGIQGCMKHGLARMRLPIFIFGNRTAALREPTRRQHGHADILPGNLYLSQGLIRPSARREAGHGQASSYLSIAKRLLAWDLLRHGVFVKEIWLLTDQLRRLTKRSDDSVRVHHVAATPSHSPARPRSPPMPSGIRR